MRHSNIAIFISHKGCPHRCSFCDQRLISGQQDAVTPAEVSRILEEAFSQKSDGRTTEIAFFGGSFTCIPKEEMEAFLQAAEPFIQQKKAYGIRISTRPDGISTDILETLQRYGVTSIELGVQSLDDRVLALNERGHTAADAEQAVTLIKQYGFSLGLQMMVGLYGDHKESLYETAQKIISMKPDTVRIYPTVVIAGTTLDHLRCSGQYKPLTVEMAVALTAPLLKQFSDNGIQVIRVGLHASKTLEKQMTAGAYHPAFRELCESFLLREELSRLLSGFPKGSRILATTAPENLSKLIGQKKSNLLWAEQKGFFLMIKPDPALQGGQIRIQLQT